MSQLKSVRQATEDLKSQSSADKEARDDMMISWQNEEIQYEMTEEEKKIVDN